MTEPQFDEGFWANVHQRAASVRELAIDELGQAEQLVLAEISDSVSDHLCAPDFDANVVPVFTEPFWEQVGQRAERVRHMAVSSVEEGQERLVGLEFDQETVTVRSGRHSAPTGLRAFFLKLGLQRSDAFGLAAAFLAVVLFVPQVIAPVMSSAGVEPPKLVQFLIIGDEEKSEPPKQPADKPGSSGESGSSSDSEEPGAPTASGDFAPAKSPVQSGSNAADGPDAVSTGEAGVSGATVDGTPAPGQGGSGTTGTAVASPAPQSSPDPSPAPVKVPSAPSGLEAVAVDSTTIRLKWIDSSSDETTFQINRTGVEAPTVTFRSVGKDVTSYMWTNVAPETRACFRIRAVSDGLSEWAPSGAPGSVCATTPAVPVDPAPTEPQVSPSAPPTNASPA